MALCQAVICKAQSCSLFLNYFYALNNINIWLKKNTSAISAVFQHSLTVLFALWKIAWVSKDTADPLISLSEHKLLGNHDKLCRCTNTQRHAQMCTRKHWHISTSKLVISVYWDTPHIINPSLVILSLRDECLCPKWNLYQITAILMFQTLSHSPSLRMHKSPWRPSRSEA